MDGLFKATLLVFILTCILMAEAFWSGLRSEMSMSYSLTKALLTGSGFAIYAVIDYMLIVPGSGYLMA